MNKHYSLIAAVALSIFSSVSMASTMSFWAYGNDDTNINHRVSNIQQDVLKEKVTISYDISNPKLIINSAKFWLKAVDDQFFPKGDTKNDPNRDPEEQALVVRINGHQGNYASKEIDELKWYDMDLDVTSILLANLKGDFKSTIESSKKGDFIFDNAKLVVDYDLKPVPVPAAVWLFSSALMGLIGAKRRKLA
jgi:hypothetical protein